MENQTTSNQVDTDKDSQGATVPFPDELVMRIHEDAERHYKLEQRIADLERRPVEVNRWMIILTAITAVIALSGVVVSYFQWRTTLTLFRQDQRPYVTNSVVPIRFGPNQPISVNLYSGNAGKSPAIRVGGSGRIFLGNDALQQAYRWFDTEANSILDKSMEVSIPPGVSASSQKDSIYSTLNSRIVGEDEFKEIVIRDFSIVVAFRQAYSDLSGNRYWNDVCVGYLASNAIVNCPKYNEPH